MRRDFCISLSLANLCFIKNWGRLLGHAGAYFNEFPIMFLGIIVDVLLLASLFWLGIFLIRKTQNLKLKTVAEFLFLLAIVTSVNGIFALLTTFLPFTFANVFGQRTAAIVGITISIALLTFAIQFRRRVIQIGPKVLMLLFPFACLTMAQAVWHLSAPIDVVANAESKNVKETQQSRATETKAKARIVWIIFDELDQQVTFSARPSNIQLPELDRIRNESLHAEKAYPPAPLTHMSIPALITGRLVAKNVPNGQNEMLLQFDGSKDLVRWSEQPNVFSEARQLGFKTGLVGWSHPYCKVLGDNLTFCSEVRESRASDLTLSSGMFENVKGVINTIPLVSQVAIPLIQHINFANRLATGGERQKYRIRYETVLANAAPAVTNPQLDLVFLHFPIPHPPGIYDKAKRDFSEDGTSGYMDNLELVDLTVGTLRREMEKKGMWDNTTVLITADHWWRTTMWQRGPFWTSTDSSVQRDMSDHRIPFILKLANQKNGTPYQQPFNTVITKDLLLAMLRGDVKDEASVVNWLGDHDSLADSPYNREDLLH